MREYQLVLGIKLTSRRKQWRKKGAKFEYPWRES